MIIRRPYLASLLFFLTIGSTAARATTPCLVYEPTVVSVTGVITRHTYPGPPNYQSVAKGDRPETNWLLKADAPICVDQSKTDPDLNPAQQNVRSIQLVLQPAQFKQFKPLAGRPVVVSGTLFGAHTGHHHTPLLLRVKDIVPRR